MNHRALTSGNTQRMLIIGLFVAVICAHTAIVVCAESKAQSQWVAPGADGKLIYKTTPAGDKILDFSCAGYMGGGIALPDVPAKRTVAPSGDKDDTAAIQNAIDEVAALPLVDGFRGTVELSAGTFKCEGSISLRVSGIVLRGAGSGEQGTTIKMVGSRHAAFIIGRGRGRQSSGPTVDDQCYGKCQCQARFLRVCRGSNDNCR